MIYSIKGKVVERNESSVAIDLGNIAYEVFVPRPAIFIVGQESLVYTYEVLTQDDHCLVGFDSKKEKDAFLLLVSVKGIGPKTALSALSKTTPDELFSAIENSNAAFLKRLPGIGPKAAQQIILDLKGRLVEKPLKKNAENRYPDVYGALKSLGFKTKEIEDAIDALPDGVDKTEVALKTALRFLSKERKAS